MRNYIKASLPIAKISFCERKGGILHMEEKALTQDVQDASAKGQKRKFGD